MPRVDPGTIFLRVTHASRDLVAAAASLPPVPPVDPDEALHCITCNERVGPSCSFYPEPMVQLA